MKYLYTFLIIGFILISACTSEEAKNEQLMRRWVKAVNEEQNITIFDKFMTPDFILHNDAQTPQNLTEVKSSFAELFADTEDFTVKAEDIICQGNRVAVRWSYKYINKETGKIVTGSSVSFDRIQDGKMAEAWEIVGKGAWDKINE